MLAALGDRLQAGDIEAARFVGLPLDRVTASRSGRSTSRTRDLGRAIGRDAGLPMASTRPGCCSARSAGCRAGGAVAAQAGPGRAP